MTSKRSVAAALFLFTSVAHAQYKYGVIPASQVPQNHSITNISELNNLAPSQADPSQSDQLLGPLMPSNARLGRISANAWIFYMYQESTGAIIPNATMVLGQLQPRVHSGGHDHDSAIRPKGFLSAHSGFTGASGLEFQSVYTAPEVSGHVQSAIGCTAPGYPSCTPGEYFVFTTAVPNLVSLNPSIAYNLVGSRPIHLSNHWGTVDFVAKLTAVANAYFMEYGSVLSINDISLATGGVFDLNADWVPDHIEHRVGITADIRTPPVAHVATLKMMLLEKGIVGRTFVHPPPGPHWHIRNFDTRE